MKYIYQFYHYLGSVISTFLYPSSSFFSYFLLIKVGIKEINPSIISVMKCFGLIPIESIYFNVKPVWINIKLFGIRPLLIYKYR
jgi:hypothetical protein